MRDAAASTAPPPMPAAASSLRRLSSRLKPVSCVVMAGFLCSIEDLEMRLGRPHRETVDRYHILRAGRERYDAVHLGAQCDVAARCADRRPDFDAIAVDYRNVHEQIERR